MLPPSKEYAGTYHFTFKGWGAMLPPTKEQAGTYHLTFMGWGAVTSNKGVSWDLPFNF